MVRKPLVPFGELQLVQSLEVEDERALRAVDLPAECVLPPSREPRRLDRSDRAAGEAHDCLERVVDFAPGEERAGRGRHRADLSDEIAREVDHVRAEVAQRT